MHLQSASTAQFDLRYTIALYANPRTVQQQTSITGSEVQPSFEHTHEIYNLATTFLPQRQQRLSISPSERPPSLADSRSVRSLRRTPRLQERRPSQPHSPIPDTRLPSVPAPTIRERSSRPQLASARIQFGQSGSTTPDSFQRLVQTDSYWPRRTTHISRRTHEAILFALEAIRTGNGVDAKQLTADLLEEGARMSDLLTGNPPSGVAGAGRTQNVGSRPVPGAGGSATNQARFRTPTVVMQERRAREARRAEQEAAKKREDERRQQTENVVGVGDDRRQTSGRTPLSEIQTGITPGSTGVTTSRRRTENIPTTNGTVPRTGGTTNPNQPRPISQQTAEQTTTGQINKNRTEALEKLSMHATAGSKPVQPPTSAYTAPAATTQPAARAGFPHAFERWETLSSHWEGLTSYWIRRLESNTEELSGKPIDQQMARQVTDLSAAGANLFHAVVELQRLRASSERKFQRWFFETRTEQEQAQERIAELERQVRHERENGGTNNESVEAIKAEKSKAEELVREMRRELQISKEEARRAWEELGRREQEERDRTIALRSGEPTLIGGVQVVPMAGMSGRHISSSSRPQTRGGPVGGAGPTQLSGQQLPYDPRETFSRSQTTLESPEREQNQFTHRPGQTSPTETDPFTETSYVNQPQLPLRHEPDTQFYSSPPHSQRSGSAAAPTRTTVSPIRGQTQSTSPGRFYQGMDTSSAGVGHRPVTSGSDNRSYIPSTASGNGSEEEYHVNPDGSYTRDAQGRRIPSGQPISGPGVEEEEEEGREEEEDDDDDDDYTADVERERMYAQQYSQRQAALSQTPRGSGSNLPITSPSASRITTVPTTQSQASPASRSYSSTVSASSQPLTQPVPATLPPDYEGSGYGSTTVHRDDDDIPSNVVTGWEGIQATPRHHHPSRLSAILEERSSRTSPSRTSYMSENNPNTQRPG